MYSYSSMLCASSGGRFELQQARGIMLVMSGKEVSSILPTSGPCGGIGKSATCVSLEGASDGQKILNRKADGMTSVQ